MFTSTVVCTTVRSLKAIVSLAIGAATIVSWAIFLLFFLDGFLNGSKSVKEKPVAQEDDPDSASWKKRVKSEKSTDNRLPVTIVTGFLGSGKTTLVKNILENTAGIRVLVIENEIGSEGIDHELLLKHTAKEEIILMNNGCICCTVRKDVIFTFHKMFLDPAFSSLDWVVIETTGLADPAPLIHSLYMDPHCSAMLRLDSVLTVVDVKHLPLHLANRDRGDKGVHGGPVEAVQQIAYADRIVLNKTDLVTEEELESVSASVQSINPTAQLLPCKYSNLPVEELLNIRAFDPTRNASLLASGKEGSSSSTTTSSIIPVDEKGKVLSKRVRVNVRTGGRSGSELCEFAVPGTEGSRVTTVSLVTERPLDLDNFNLWIASLMKSKGESIYRLKGILSMKGYNQQFVAQGIHMIFDGELGPDWKDGQARRSKLVLIGLDLNTAELENEFQRCEAT
jgi:G3E family GTPase